MKSLEGELKGDRLVRLNRLRDRLEKLKSSGVECSDIEKLINGQSERMAKRRLEKQNTENINDKVLNEMQSACQFFWRSVSFGLDKAELALETAENKAIAIEMSVDIRNKWFETLNKNDQFLREKNDRLSSVDERIFKLGKLDFDVDKMNRQVQNIQDNCQRRKLRLPNPARATIEDIDLLNEQSEIFYEDTDAQCDKLEEQLSAKEEEVSSGHLTAQTRKTAKNEPGLWDQLNAN